MDNIWWLGSPCIVDGLGVFAGAVFTLVAHWLRTRAQRVVIEQAVADAEARRLGEGLDDNGTKELAFFLSWERMGVLLRPADGRMEKLVKAADKKHWK